MNIKLIASLVLNAVLLVLVFLTGPIFAAELFEDIMQVEIPYSFMMFVDVWKIIIGRVF